MQIPTLSLVSLMLAATTIAGSTVTSTSFVTITTKVPKSTTTLASSSTSISDSSTATTDSSTSSTIYTPIAEPVSNSTLNSSSIITNSTIPEEELQVTELPASTTTDSYVTSSTSKASKHSSTMTVEGKNAVKSNSSNSTSKESKKTSNAAALKNTVSLSAFAAVAVAAAVLL